MAGSKNKEEKREQFLQLKHSTRPKACGKLPESNPHRSMAENIASAEENMQTRVDRIRRCREARLRMGAKLRKLTIAKTMSCFSLAALG